MTVSNGLNIKAAGIFIVIFFLFFVMLVLQCCLGSRTTKKVVKRRRRFGGSYEDIPRRVSHSERVRSVALASAPFETVLDTEIDGIVVIPEHNEDSPVVVPPYPVEPRHPTPQSARVPTSGLGFATHNPPYPTHTPHPVPGVDYCLPSVGASSALYSPAGSTPYPLAGSPHSAAYPDYDSQPPSYSEVVSQSPAQLSTSSKARYTKQAPYNPSY